MTEKEKHEQASRLSRRGFLKGVGAGTVATGLLQETQEALAQSEGAEQALKGLGKTPVTLQINGKDHKLEIEPRVTLLDALRNDLEITGSKKVCDRGTCGACTVLLDGDPVYSCSILAIEAQGHDIQTIESLGTPEDMTDVQQAFVDNDAQQCGFCTPGFVVACTAFIKEHPDATLEEVRENLGGNLCRCGTYSGISDAMLEVAKKAAKGGA